MATFIGSFKFSFAAGALPSSPDQAASYPVKFPECPGSLAVNVETVDNEEPVAGVNSVTDSVVTKSALEYSITCKSYDLNVLSFLLGGTTPTTNTPPTSISVGADLAHSGYGFMEWYKNGDVSGTPIRKHHSFSCQIIPDGEVSADPTKFSEFKFKIKVTAAKGTLV
jgi:hypothetical protein